MSDADPGRRAFFSSFIPDLRRLSAQEDEAEPAPSPGHDPCLGPRAVRGKVRRYEQTRGEDDAS